MMLNGKYYPISGPYREPLVLLEWMIVFIFMELGLYIYWKRRQIKKDERSSEEQAHIMFLIGYATMWAFNIMGDYYSEDQLNHDTFQLISFSAIIFFGFFYFYFMEKDKPFASKHIFTPLFSIITVLSIFLIVIIQLDTAIFIILTLYIILLTAFMSTYFYKLYTSEMLHNIQKYFNVKIGIFALGNVLTCFGFILALNFFLPTLNLYFRFFGVILQLLGILLIFIYFVVVPPFSDYNWQDKIERIFIMLNSGLCIYYNSFKEKAKNHSGQMISAITKSVKEVLDTVTEKKGVSIIEKEDQILIIQPGNNFTGVVICHKEINSLKILLKKLIERVDGLYSANFIEEWDHDLAIFSPLEEIAKEIFIL